MNKNTKKLLFWAALLGGGYWLYKRSQAPAATAALATAAAPAVTAAAPAATTAVTSTGEYVNI